MCVWTSSVAICMARTPSDSFWNFIFQPSITSCRSLLDMISGGAVSDVDEVAFLAFTVIAHVQKGVFLMIGHYSFVKFFNPILIQTL